MHRKKVKKNFFGGGKIFFFLEKPVFFRAKYKTVIRRGPNAILSLLLSAYTTVIVVENSSLMSLMAKEKYFEVTFKQ